MQLFDARLPDRFWNKVMPEPNSGCWFWVAYTNPDGYGMAPVGRKARLTHRIAYTALVGEIPQGLEIDHLCRNRACCNPAHLEAVTRSVNVKRGLSPQQLVDRQRAKTHCPSGHAYEGNNIIWYRGHRKCRACDNARSRARHARKRAAR